MLSIVIVNYRTWDVIQRNLDNLRASLPPGQRLADVGLEVVVVDNHSDDGRLDEFRRHNPDVTVQLSAGNFGYAHGCNSGARAARGDWLLFMNPDVVCDWPNLQALWQAAREHAEWAILSAPQYDDRGRLQRAFGPFTSLATFSPAIRTLLRWLRPQRYPDPRTPPEQIKGILAVDWVSGSLLLTSRAVFERLGGWDEDFWLYSEDADICRRAHDLGLAVGYFPGARFRHSHAAATRANPAVKVLSKSETLLSKYVYLRKHEPGWQGRLMRAWLQLQVLLARPFYDLLDILLLGRSGSLHQRRLIWHRLWDYFRRVRRDGVILSERSRNYPGVESVS